MSCVLLMFTAFNVIERYREISGRKYVQLGFDHSCQLHELNVGTKLWRTLQRRGSVTLKRRTLRRKR